MINNLLIQRKILAGAFQCESNTFVKNNVYLKDFDITEGSDVLNTLAAIPVFIKSNIDAIPLISAIALPGGIVCETDFNALLNKFIELTKSAITKYGKNSCEGGIAGIYLYLHGSMFVENIGCGEEAIIKSLRLVAGDDMPFSVALDAHANLSDGFINNVNAISGFRTIPHTDAAETEIRAAHALITCIEEKILPNIVYQRIPILAADSAVTSKLPLSHVAKFITDLDNDTDIVSSSFFSGQPWYDAGYTGHLLCVSCKKNIEKAQTELKKIAKELWENRECFLVEGALTVEATIKESIMSSDGLTFVTDSGDNTTAGADGSGTILLRQYLDVNTDKRILICGIFDPENTKKAMSSIDGSKLNLIFGNGSELAPYCELNVKRILAGRVMGWSGNDAGNGVILRAGNIDILITDERVAFTSLEYFVYARVNIYEYDITVLKMGYLFPKLVPLCNRSIFCLSPGVSTNDFNTLDYKNFTTPRWPIHDNFEYR